MKKTLLFGILALFVNTVCFAQSNYTESLTITTYYPAPYGVYRNLKLNPSPLPNAGVDRGVMYYDNSSNLLRYYNGSVWINVSDGGDGFWRQNGTDIESTNPGNVSVKDICTEGGICLTTAPFQTGMIEGSNPACPTGTIAVMKASGGIWHTDTAVATWDKIVCGKQTTSDGTPMLVNKQHTQGDCRRAGGTVEPDGSGNNMCRLGSDANPISDCSSVAGGWRQYDNWYTTKATSASSDCGTTSSGYHAWANNAAIECGCAKVETCCPSSKQCFYNRPAAGFLNNYHNNEGCAVWTPCAYRNCCSACEQINPAPRPFCRWQSCGCHADGPWFYTPFAVRSQVGCY